MVKVYKAVIYITDYNNEIADLEMLNYRIGDGLTDGVGVHIGEVKESRNFEWNDDLIINKIYSQSNDFEKYFKD